MKYPSLNEGSGISSPSRRVVLHHTGSGVRKSSARRTKSKLFIQTTEEERSQNEDKWQAYFDSARDASTDTETVRVLLVSALKEECSKKEAKEICDTNTSEYSDHDVKGLMAQIYQDLHNVATAQAFKTGCEEACTGRFFIGEVSDIDELLQKVSVEVSSAIKSAFAHLQKSEGPQSEETCDNDGSTTRHTPSEHPANERYGKLAADHGWKFLSKLAHSAAFREAAHNLDASKWQVTSATINRNFVSLDVFIENCSLEWWTEPIRLNSLFSPSLDFSKCRPDKPKKYSPHKWIVTPDIKDVRRPTFEGKHQLNIRKNIYRASAFATSPRSPHWPRSRPYPEDPTLVHYPSPKPCKICASHLRCTCTFSTPSPLIHHPLVELHSYGPPRGLGIRALSRIPANAILAEYIGEICPAIDTSDPIYGFDFSLPHKGPDDVVAVINAKGYGNWTRFINHSCEASARFSTVRVGERYRVVVKTVREVEVYEELTVDYGDVYWTSRRCECGAEGCCEREKEVEIIV